MGRRFGIIAALLAAAPTFAQTPGPAPTRSDMSTAAPTARSGPDAGQAYTYPPNTGAILPPASRTPYSEPPTAAQKAQNEPIPSTGIVPGTGVRATPQ